MQIHKTCTLLAAALLAVSQGVAAHEGHDHDAEKPSISLPAASRAEAVSDVFELVAIAQSGEITVYLDRFATNEPVRDAAIAVETPQGSVEAKASADGTYRLAAPWSVPAGRYDLIFTVAKDTVADVMPLTLEVPKQKTSLLETAALGLSSPVSGFGFVGALLLALVVGGLGGMALARRKSAASLLLVGGLAGLLANSALAHEGEDHGPTAPLRAMPSREVAQLLADGSIFVPKSTQRILAIRTLLSEPAVHRRNVELPGRIIPDPNASGFVQTAVGGRLTPPEGGFPRLGMAVKKGDVLAYVTPPMQAIDVSDMRQRQGELDQQISIVERRLARYQQLLPSGAVPQAQFDDTRLELQGLKERRASLDTVRREPEALVAPVDGVVADGNPVAGQIAQTNAVVFHIIDPARLWVEALSYEASPNLSRASARLGDKELSLSFRGAGFADKNQSIPIHFAIEGDTAGVRIGQFVTVLAETPEEQRGIALPRTSLVRSAAGQDVVFEHVAAERFEARAVRVEPLDGQRVLVSQGLTPGKRVVVQGAELIDHIR